jgi:hypothetical protein
MNINLHNYEEYFILYVDNELNSDERLQVEEFVLKNPDLKADLDILLQYKLVPDTNIVFAGKEDLMKHGNLSPDKYPDVLEANYPEWLMLYMDNELTAAERISVEQFMATHPAAKDELAVLMRTQLQPEEIHFPNKESLYRREENADSYRERAIPIRWWRIAAAAVLFLAAGLTIAIVINKKPSGNKDELVKAPVNSAKATPENEGVAKKKEEPKQLPFPIHPDNVEKAIASTTKQLTIKPAIKQKNVAINEKKLLKKSSDQKEEKESPVLADNNPKPSNNLPQPVNPSVINNAASDIANNNTVNSKGKIREDEEQTSTVTVTPNTTQTSYSETSTDQVLSQSGGKKSKLRGFFRKITRTFEKATKIDAADDDKVLIGGLAFKLK